MLSQLKLMVEASLHNSNSPVIVSDRSSDSQCGSLTSSQGSNEQGSQQKVKKSRKRSKLFPSKSEAQELIPCPLLRFLSEQS